MTAAAAIVDTPVLGAAGDYLGLSAQQRYSVVSQHFSPWLLTEPIEFPPHHPTYGWACRVEGCDSGLSSTDTRLLCSEHAKQYRNLEDSADLDEFVRAAKPAAAHRLGWALSRKPDCGICGSKREAQQLGYCQRHSETLRSARREGTAELKWQRSQHPLPPLDRCSIPRCVHDGELNARLDATDRRICRNHLRQWRHWLTIVGRAADSRAWDAWLTAAPTRESVTPPSSRGRLSLAKLPLGLQHEIRYALHRHANTARRTHWRPTDLQTVIDVLAASTVTSLGDPLVADLGNDSRRGTLERRIWLDLPFAARSLTVTDEIAKAAGWFDPVIVGSSPFPGTQGHENRRKAWNLTAVSQRWLRDLIWEHLQDEALKPSGKRPGAGTVYNRITAIALLSHIFRQNRGDHGDNPALLGSADASAVKDTWDLWVPGANPHPLPDGGPLEPIQHT